MFNIGRLEFVRMREIRVLVTNLLFNHITILGRPMIGEEKQMQMIVSTISNFCRYHGLIASGDGGVIGKLVVRIIGGRAGAVDVSLEALGSSVVRALILVPRFNDSQVQSRSINNVLVRCSISEQR
jgi:hypothetical protein